MCYAIPGKVTEINRKIVVVDYFGEKRKVLNEFENIKIGDYVYAHGGIIIQKVPEREAVYILKAWKNKFFKLKEIDIKLSKKRTFRVSNRSLDEILNKIENGKKLKKIEILRLLAIKNKRDLEMLFNAANKTRHKYLKNSCCIHGIIEFSNFCRNNCFYCGIRRDNSRLKRYRMGIDEIIKTAGNAVSNYGFKALVLQSGEDVWYTAERLVEIVEKIRRKYSVLLFLSIGSRDFGTYKKLYKAGARGALIRFETSNNKLYKKIHEGPKAHFKERINLIKSLRKIGYIIATGSLIGLPGQNELDLLNDILLTKSLGAEMYSFGPLIPNPNTPFTKLKTPDINLVLKVIAVSRLLDKNSKILVTTALQTLDKKNGARLGLLAGGNSLMINATPNKYKKFYSIYPNKSGNDKTIKENITSTLKLLYSLGRAPTDLGR